ncbi:hypothetical protein E0H80_05250 [Acinetobacter sp. ANC 4779]|uniref:hypothetical protein n=1 Tax=Acinetobacter sp. ANC 4779 TaxID=2529848 RepID=UPI00103AF953|nr:hypothetical protein [Acinetobacter sp. ANC 4779]TCB51418.1 hypothetical protein E0H80_05250 [Acinetobacter sp. ANC 4779]
MKHYQRAALALVVAKLEFGNTKSNIYDYNESVYPQISGNVNQQEAKLFDYHRSVIFEGRNTGREFNLYDYGHSEFISLKKKGVKKYEGYHYGSSSYFEITISGSTLSFYDFGTEQYFRFS